MAGLVAGLADIAVVVLVEGGAVLVLSVWGTVGY